MLCPNCEDPEGKYEIVSRTRIRKNKAHDVFRCPKCGEESDACLWATEDDEEYW